MTEPPRNDIYHCLNVEVPEADAELAQAHLHDFEPLGVEVRDGSGPTMPGVPPPPKGQAVLIGFFEDERAANQAHAALREAVPSAHVVASKVEGQDWSESWKALIRSVEVGRLWVGPPWEAPRAPADKVKLFIEPKMAFGTGDHPTTMLCLAEVDGFLAKNPGASVLDVGTGTAVLAMAGRKLGASRVVGVDNDPMSVTLARENAVANGCGDLDLSDKPLTMIQGTFDLVLANILANTLMELAPLIVPKVGRQLVLAGILSGQADEVEGCYRALGLRPLRRTQQGDWVCLALTREG